MNTFDEEDEEHMIDQLFFSCDIHKTGLVEVHSVVEFLKKECNKSKSNEPDLVELASILTCNSKDGLVDIITFRRALRQWIAAIRNRSESTSFLGSVSEPDILNMTNNSTDLSACIETSASHDDSVFKHSQDVAELLNDLKFQNRKVCDENDKLQTQLETQEETVASLTRELESKVKEEEKMRKRLESLQDQVNMGQMLVEENEVLKIKLEKLQEVKRELDMEVNRLIKENSILDKQAWTFENKWQKSTSDMALLKKDFEDLRCSYLEQKDLLNQAQQSKSVITENSTEEKRLQGKIDALLKENEQLKEEKELAQSQLQRVLDVSVEEDQSQEAPKLVCSTPGPTLSICMELKDRLNEDKHLPSPLCEKRELSRELLFHRRSAVLPAYMSAWDLEFSTGSVSEYSIEQLRNDSPLKPLELDIEKKLASVKKRGQNGLEKEIINLYRVNLDLAEKCHKAELRETELQDEIKKNSQTAQQEKQRSELLEESLNHSVLARNVDLKDLWRLVHSPEEEEESSSESDNSLSASTEILKQQIKQDIEALREKLKKRETVLQSLRKSVPRLPFRHKGRPPKSGLVDALNIDHITCPDTESGSSFECPTGLSVQTECKDCNKNQVDHSQNLHHKNNIRSVPLLRRRNKIHNSYPHWCINHHFNDSSNVMELEVPQNNNVVAVKNKLNASQSSWNYQGDILDPLGPAQLPGEKSELFNQCKSKLVYTKKTVNLDKTKQTDENKNSKVPLLRRRSYVSAIENEGCSPEDIDGSRQRSDSFQTAIEQGQLDRVESYPSEEDITESNDTLDPIPWKNIPKYASTPLPVTYKPVVKSVNFYPKIFVKEESMELSDEISDISNTGVHPLQSEDSDNSGGTIDDCSNGTEMNHSTEKLRKSYQNNRSSCKELSVLTEEELPCVCCGQDQIIDELISPPVDRNSFPIEDFSPEVWTLSRTSDNSDLSSSRDSGHSSSITTSCNGHGQEEPDFVNKLEDKEIEIEESSIHLMPEALQPVQQQKDKCTSTDEMVTESIVSHSVTASNAPTRITVQITETDIQHADTDKFKQVTESVIRPGNTDTQNVVLQIKQLVPEGEEPNHGSDTKCSLVEDAIVGESLNKTEQSANKTDKSLKKMDHFEIKTDHSDTKTDQHAKKNDLSANKVDQNANKFVSQEQCWKDSVVKPIELSSVKSSINMTDVSADDADASNNSSFLKTPHQKNIITPLLAISPLPSPPQSPCINFHMGKEKMKGPKAGQLPDQSRDEEQNNNKSDTSVSKTTESEQADVDSGPRTASYLAKIRETHLAKRRDQLRQSKMPELSEMSEKDGTDDSVKPGTTAANDVAKSNIIQPPEPNGDILPSIPNEFLQKLGISSDDVKEMEEFRTLCDEINSTFGNNLESSDELSDQEIETKFASLSLAFKTDAQTLEKRLEIQERSRDIAEQNVDKELQGLRTALSKLNQICTDPQVREVLSKIQNHIDILEKSSARVSSRAEVFGAIQQEKRLSKAVDIMVHHVENIHRVHEKEHAELEEARKLLQDSRSLGPSALDISGGDMLARRSASVCPNNIGMGKSFGLGTSLSGSLTPATVKAIKLMKPRRRVSEIALPKVLGGSGAPNLHPSPSMDHAFETRSPRGFMPLRSEFSVDEDEGNSSHTVQNDTTDSVSRTFEKDPRSRFQAVVASTTVKSAIANTLRKTYNDKPNNVGTTPLNHESPQVSRTNSTESNKDPQEKEKQQNLEEEAYKKGYEQGMRASLGQDLSSLREQQNRINESLGDIMDNIDNHMEEPKGLREILQERFHGNFPKIQISSWRIRITMSCFFVIMAILSILMSLFPVNNAEMYSYRTLGHPTL